MRAVNPRRIVCIEEICVKTAKVEKLTRILCKRHRARLNRPKLGRLIPSNLPQQSRIINPRNLWQADLRNQCDPPKNCTSRTAYLYSSPASTRDASDSVWGQFFLIDRLPTTAPDVSTPTESDPDVHPRLEDDDGAGAGVVVARVDSVAHAVVSLERVDQNLQFSTSVLLCLISKRNQCLQHAFSLRASFEIYPINILIV